MKATAKDEVPVDGGGQEANLEQREAKTPARRRRYEKQGRRQESKRS
jgi:hypothetical protein